MQKTHKAHKHSSRSPKQRTPKLVSKEVLLYGWHPVVAAIHNPNRHIKQLCTCDTTYAALSPATRKILSDRNTDVKLLHKQDIAHMVPDNVPHQGIVAVVAPLPPVALTTVLKNMSANDKNTVVVLDQVCDPHNIGAILRSSAIFGAQAVIVVDKNSPQETGVLAKSASGALEKIPLVRVPNMKQGLTTLKKHGFWCVGLSSNADMEIQQYSPSPNTALVMGAEGAGIRRLTEKTCDILVHIPTPCADYLVDSLNVSNAAAIALYCITTAQ